MFKKIQKKLLLNYPLLWNIKIIPMGITVLGFNILYFFLGFITGDIDFQKINYYKEDSFTIFFLITILTSILTLIVWLVYYLKNNGFKSFYPKKRNSLYWEWLLIFILLFGICLYPFSYFQGNQAKERSYATKEEVLEIQKFLNKIDILIPESDSYYYLRMYSKTAPVPKNSGQDLDSISISLLNFNRYSTDSSDIQQVKKWLVEEKQDSIRNLIHQYFKLQEKHKLTSNLTVDSWMKLIYNPPTYTVSPSNYINKDKINVFHHDSPTYYVEYNSLESGYNKIYNAHYYSDSFYNSILVIFYIALGLSLFLLSFRITSGKSWLIAFVVGGLLAFINGIISATFGILTKGDDGIIYLTITYWLVLFFFMCFYVGRKIYTKSFKGKSMVMVNLLVWMIPYVLMLFYGGFMASKPVNYYNENYIPSDYTIYNFFDMHPSVFFWINLIFIVISLFFITKTIKQWKALPEE